MEFVTELQDCSSNLPPGAQESKKEEREKEEQQEEEEDRLQREKWDADFYSFSKYLLNNDNV